MPLSSIKLLYQDDDLLVVEKPTMLLSVPGRAAHNKDSLILRLQQNGYPQALIVHRLDCETTGLMVLACNKESHAELSRQFRERLIPRSYTALCWGATSSSQGQIELPMRYDPPNKPRQTIDHELGKTARTYWQLIGVEQGYSRLKLKPHTGRSHQLRVHLKAIGHPILGDALYAHDAALHASQRMCLHASKLTFTHPSSGQTMDFSSTAPF